MKTPLPSRDLGGMFTIDNPDDGTPIKKMFALNDSLLLISEKCTYRIQVADQIDPDRKNPALPPNFQQKLFDYGTNSELLCRTLLQAQVMFRKEFQSVDIDKAMQLSFDALGDLVSMYENALAFKSAEQAAIEKTERVERQESSQTVPAVGNVRSYCKSFAQKADHFAFSLLEIVRLFYPEMNKKMWDAFHTLVKSRFGESDQFYKVVEQTTRFLRLIRNARDCLEHANLKGVETRDFEPQLNGAIAVPSIEINFRGSIYHRRAISSLMEETTNKLMVTFEMIIVHLCSKNIRRRVPFPMFIGLLSENQQKGWHVRFAYGAYDQGGQFVPCG
jgi:hypothetical protein